MQSEMNDPLRFAKYDRAIDAITAYLIEFSREDDGRWIAEIPSLPGVMAYGGTQEEAKLKVETLALVRLNPALNQPHRDGWDY